MTAALRILLRYFLGWRVFDTGVEADSVAAFGSARESAAAAVEKGYRNVSVTVVNNAWVVEARFRRIP